MRAGFKRHPLSALYGDMPEDLLISLAEDVGKHGILKPVVLFDGMVLDGWHRCQAGQMAQVEVPTEDYEGDDPAGFAASMNMFRRHNPLTASQRAAVILESYQMCPKGRRKQIGNVADLTRSELAEKAGTGERTIADAQKAREGGLGEAVKNGEISANKAAKQVREKDQKERGTVADLKTKPKKPAPEDKYKEEICTLREQLVSREEMLQELTDQQESEADARLPDSEMQVKFEQLREEKRALVSQLNECKQKSLMLLRETKSLRKRLGLK